MPTPHINANRGDFANVVLMPGDPLRARWIADTFLHNVKEVTNLRGMLGFTGYTENGKRISVMASGMGQPSVGIYSHELYSSYDVDVIIRVGTCGAYQPEVNLFDVILAIGASTDSSWYKQYGLDQFSANCDFEVALAIYNKANEKKKRLHTGNVLSADVFYDSDPNSWKRWASMGILAVEMESYALYCNALRLKKKAACLLTVTDNFLNPDEKATGEQRQAGLKEMIEIAILGAEQFCTEHE